MKVQKLNITIAQMNILQVAHSFPPDRSGVSEVVSNLSSHLVQRGHQVHVATAGTSPSVERLADGVVVHRFDIHGNTVTGIRGSHQAYLELALQRRWDVIVMHNVLNWQTELLLPYLAEQHSATVLVSHGATALRRPECASAYALLLDALQHIDRVVLLASDSPDYDVLRLSKDDPRLSVISNAVDLAKFSNIPRGIRSRWSVGCHPWLLNVANHSPVKNHNRFIEAGLGVRMLLPDVRATIIGSAHLAERWNLGRLLSLKGGCWMGCRARAALNRSWLNLKPGVARSDVIAALTECDVVVLTSHSESSPIVILEAMASRTPWVSTNVGCVSQYPGGIVVESDRQLTETLVRLLRNPDEREHLGRAGLQYVSENHRWEHAAAQYETTLLSACVTKAQSHRAPPHAHADTFSSCRSIN